MVRSESGLSLEESLCSSPREFLLSKLDSPEDRWGFLKEMENIPAGPPEHHKEGSVLEHTIRVVEEAAELVANENIDSFIAICALFHDVGKVATEESELPSHPKHEKTGKDIAEELGREFGFTEEEIEAIGLAARMHMRFHKLTDLREATLLRSIKELNRNPIVTSELFVWLAKADSLGRVPQSESDSEQKIDEINIGLKAMENITEEEIVDGFSVHEDEKEKIKDILLQERVKWMKSARDN